jgi:hypothetical protein
MERSALLESQVWSGCNRSSVMGDLDAVIARYIDAVISLSAKDIQASAASRKWFLTRIRNEIEAREDGPQLLAGDDAFVNFGSYFKGTKVADVDEYDVLVVIDSCSGVFSPGGERHGDGQGTADPNHKYDARFKKADGSGVSPPRLTCVSKCGAHPLLEFRRARPRPAQEQCNIFRQAITTPRGRVVREDPDGPLHQ